MMHLFRRGGSLRSAVRRLAALSLVLCALLLAGPTSVAVGRGVRGTEVGPWVLGSTRVEPDALADQGVATVTRDGTSTVLTRGDASIPTALSAQGWVHIGDPDSRSGYLIDAYQGTASAAVKLFVVTAPNGTRTYLEHRLLPGESYHNSFAAFSPDLRWFIAGEWGSMHRFLVFSMAGAGPTSAAHPRVLRLASTIRLSHAISDIQGCVFSSSTSLLCSSSDASATVFPVADPLLGVHLDRSVGRRSDPGAVSLVGALPQDQACSAIGEAEGIDLHGATLTVAVNSRCRAATLVRTLHLEQT